MVEMLLGGKMLQHWQQFKSQAIVCCEDPETLSLELYSKTKGFGNLAHGGLTTGNQQYIGVFSSDFELQAPGRQACKDCPPTHPSGLEAHNDMC
eukprot:1082051-Ditylum_brightwellii.AAC.1